MKKFFTITALVIITSGLNAQQEYIRKEYSIIAALIEKNWNGSGVLMGHEATFSMDWQRVLNNKFLKLEFQNKRKSEDDLQIVFKATAFYKIVNDTMVVGNWFDNRGVTFPLHGSISENEMTILWGTEETEMGKTIYRLTTNNVIAVEDYIFSNGKYSKFGSAAYNIKD